LYLDGKIIENKGQADSETATNFSKVYSFDAEVVEVHLMIELLKQVQKVVLNLNY